MSTTAVTEKGIILDAMRVRAALDGRLTQIRVRVTQQPIERDGVWLMAQGRFGRSRKFYTNELVEITKNTKTGKTSQRRFKESFDAFMLRNAPYKAADRLWVKEAWRVNKQFNRLNAPKILIAFGGDYHGCHYEADGDQLDWVGCLRNGRYMPRAFSRLTLEVKAVRVERVNEISEVDAEASGAQRQKHDHTPLRSYRMGFERHYDSLHGPGSFAAGHWVWVLEVEKV